MGVSYLHQGLICGFRSREDLSELPKIQRPLSLLVQILLNRAMRNTSPCQLKPVLLTFLIVGSLVLIDGMVYHKSGANNSDNSRWIYTFHCIEGQAEYPGDNWLQPTEEVPFTDL